jgi:hypothetical protein
MKPNSTTVHSQPIGPCFCPHCGRRLRAEPQIRIIHLPEEFIPEAPPVVQRIDTRDGLSKGEGSGIGTSLT